MSEPLQTSETNVETLLEALPYIREFHGRTVVIKYGGAAMRDESLREAFATDVVLLKYVGLNPIVVHGGGPEITEYMERLGLEVRFHEGLRVSDAETVEVARMVLLGKLNSDIVQRLNRHGQPAVGLSGQDGSLFEVAPVANAEQVGFVGTIERVDVDVLNHIAADYIPVIASSASDREGNPYNVNADEAAGKVAAALGAYKSIFLTDVVGWLEDPADEASLISRASVAEVDREAGRDRRRHAPEADRLRRRDQRRLPVRPHRRRPPPAQPPARALHRRRHRHHGHAREPDRPAGARGALPDADLQAGAGRVRPRRGVAALGRRGQGVPRLPGRDLGLLGRPLQPGRGRGGPRAGRPADPRLQPLLHRADGAARRAPLESSLGGRVFFSNSGTEANECAIKVARKHAHARGIEAPEIVSFERDFHGRTYGSLAATPAMAANEALGPDAAGLPLGPAQRRRPPSPRPSARAPRRS